jgi:hypothetical protein
MMRLTHERISLNSRSSHLPDFDHLVIKTFAKHLSDLNDGSVTSEYHSTNLENLGYSGVTQKRDLAEVEHW